MTTITSLPDELIDIILKNKSISIVDIVNFMTTCKKFHKIAQSNQLWEIKFYQRSPSANNIYNNNFNIEKRKKNFEQVDFKKEIESSVKCIKKLRYYHSLMCINNLWKSKATKLNNLLCSTATKPMIYYFIIDDLYRMLSQLSGHPDSISIYHLGIIFRCLKQHRLTYKLNKYNSKPIQKQLLEKQLIIIAQYFQPHMSYSGIRMWLNDIASEVQFRIQKQYPMHSIFFISFEQFSFWRDNNIEDNFWDQTEAKQIMHVLEDFIFAELQNHKLINQFWKTLNLENKYVSENVQRYLLIMTYHIVARRLGIRCNLVSYYGPNHKIHLRILWKPKYHVGNDILKPHPYSAIKFHFVRNLDNAEYLFLNNKSHLPYPLNIVKKKLRGNEKEAMRYIKWNNAVEWKRIIKNTTLKIIRLFYQHQMRNKPDCSWEYNTILYAMIHLEIQKPNIADFVVESGQVSYKSNFLTRSQLKRRKKIKERNDKIRFAVGMIVTHSSQIIVRDSYEYYNSTRDNYINNEYRLTNTHDGVIVGWDYSHQILNSSLLPVYPHLRRNPHSDRCICHCAQYYVTNALHYSILSENNIICYVSEDNISICSPKKINNVEIGRFFSKFEGTHYVLNEWLAEAYPEDTAALSQILANQ